MLDAEDRLPSGDLQILGPTSTVLQGLIYAKSLFTYDQNRGQENVATVMHVVILIENFRRIAQINRQFPSDCSRQLVIYLILNNRKSRFNLIDVHKYTLKKGERVFFWEDQKK